MKHSSSEIPSPAPAEPVPGGLAPGPGSAVSRCGGLAVTTTCSGLPVTLRIDGAQLAASPAVLAARIVALAALARGASAHDHRRRLQESGTPVDVLDALNLPDRAALMDLEQAVDRWFGAAS